MGELGQRKKVFVRRNMLYISIWLFLYSSVKSNFLKWPLFIGNYLIKSVGSMAYFWPSLKASSLSTKHAWYSNRCFITLSTHELITGKSFAHNQPAALLTSPVSSHKPKFRTHRQAWVLTVVKKKKKRAEDEKSNFEFSIYRCYINLITTTVKYTIQRISQSKWYKKTCKLASPKEFRLKSRVQSNSNFDGIIKY